MSRERYQKVYSKAEMPEQNLCFNYMAFTESATAEAWDRNSLGLSHATVTSGAVV